VKTTIDDELRKKVLTLYDKYHPKTVMEAVRIAAGWSPVLGDGEAERAIKAVKASICDLEQATTKTSFFSAVEQLNKSAHRIQCLANCTHICESEPS